MVKRKYKVSKRGNIVHKRFKEDVEDIPFGKVQKHRSLSFGEGDGG